MSSESPSASARRWSRQPVPSCSPSIPDLIHRAEAWLLRRILRICTEEEAEIFWGDGEIPEELLFQDPPFFRDTRTRAGKTYRDRAGISSICPGFKRLELIPLALFRLATLVLWRWAIVQRLSPRPTR